MFIHIHGTTVHGAIDHETRCKHYQTEKDRIAIKFYCCKQFFPCYLCHAEYGCGKGMIWPQDTFNEEAILCGACGTTLSIQDYLACENVCPSCQARFNPGCLIHQHLYFSID